MTTCSICKISLGIERTHAEDEICPVRAAWFCNLCNNRGHRPGDCDEINHVERPRFYEDLIPADLLERWGLTHKKTPLPLDAITLEVAEREIAATNTIEIVYPKGKPDSSIRKVARQYKLHTPHSMEKSLLVLRGWAVRHGKKIRLVQEK